MKEYFLKLYKYNRWSNARVVLALEKQAVGDEKILSLMGHVAAAQVIWLHRIKGLPPPDLKLWATYALAQVAELAKTGDNQWVDFVVNNDNFNRELNYKNFVGEPYVNNVEMIMIHVVNHGTYHRGQIAQLLRQKGFEPANTDFITYDRVIRGQLKD